jgi:hypothetical protein
MDILLEQIKIYVYVHPTPFYCILYELAFADRKKLTYGTVHIRVSRFLYFFGFSISYSLQLMGKIILRLK